MLKKINHLGSNLEKMSTISNHLSSLSDQLNTLQQATNELKLTYKDCLPETILTNCWVVNISVKSITLAVNSTTAANHITYMKQDYLKILKEQSTSFKEIEELKVIVADF